MHATSTQRNNTSTILPAPGEFNNPCSISVGPNDKHAMYNAVDLNKHSNILSQIPELWSTANRSYDCKCKHL